METDAIIGIICHSENQSAYFSEDETLHTILSILMNDDKIDKNLYTKNDDIYINTNEKMAVHNINYQLPWPFHIYKVIYKDIQLKSEDDILQILTRECEEHEEESE